VLRVNCCEHQSSVHSLCPGFNQSLLRSSNSSAPLTVSCHLLHPGLSQSAMVPNDNPISLPRYPDRAVPRTSPPFILVWSLCLDRLGQRLGLRSLPTLIEAKTGGRCLGRDTAVTTYIFIRTRRPPLPLSPLSLLFSMALQTPSGVWNSRVSSGGNQGWHCCLRYIFLVCFLFKLN